MVTYIKPGKGEAKSNETLVGEELSNYRNKCLVI